MSPARVLIIDDSVVVRHLVRNLLTGKPGIGSVLEAASADAAWRLIDNEPIDVVTLDLNLPDADGLQIIEQLKAKTGGDVIVLSGDRATHAAAMDLGAAACFEKERLLPERAAFLKCVRNAGDAKAN